MTRRFPLQSVLRWREQCEAGEERALLAAQADLLRVEAALAKVGKELALQRICSLPEEVLPTNQIHCHDM